MNEHEENKDEGGANEGANSVRDEVENGKNKYLVKCKFCPSRILNPKLGSYTDVKFNLPTMARKKKGDEEQKEVEYETLSDFWQVNDMYTFENIGFSNTVENMKYLACADCEIGPVGYFNIDTKISYVALDRVNHVK